MNINLLGIKLGITQIFTKTKILIPVTIVKIKSGININNNQLINYYNTKFSFFNIINKNILGFLNKYNNKNYIYLKKYKQIKNKIFTLDKFKFNNLINLNITSFSIGKGTLGNIKRHHFNRGPMSHGSKHHRLQGSLGAGTSPGRVFPGKKMSGHDSNKKITIKNLLIINIDFINNLILIKGHIPGKKGNIIYINT